MKNRLSVATKAAWVALVFNPCITSMALTDSDADGVESTIDNCTLIPNPLRTDTDSDGYDNAGDPDFNNDGIVNFVDVALFTRQFLSNEAVFDLTGDGIVNFPDF